MLALLFCGALAASEFEVVINAHVNVPHERGTSPLEGVQIDVSLDPLWGTRDEAALETFKNLFGPLPDVSVTGSGVTDELGRVDVRVRVTWSGEGQLPVQTLRHESGEEIQLRYVHLRVRPTKEGYRVWHRTHGGETVAPDAARTVRATEGRWQFSSHTMVELCIIKGRAVHLTGREPAAGLPMALVVRGFRGNTEQRFETVTDDDGRFEFNDPHIGEGKGHMEVVGNEHALIRTSAGRNLGNLNWGVLDVGTLVVAPAGGARVRFTRAGDDSAAQVDGYLTDGSRFHVPFKADEDGVVSLEGLPVGRFSLYIAERSNEYASPPVHELVISAGETTEVGPIKVEPWRSLEVIVLGGGGIERYVATAVYDSLSHPHIDLQRHVGSGFNRGQQVTRMAQLTAEANRIPRMFSGEWTVRIQIEGFADITEVVTLPRDEPLMVTATAAGVLEARIEGRDHWGHRRFVAVRQGSAAYKATLHMDSHEFRQWFESGVIEPSADVLIATGGQAIANAPPGLYRVMALDNGRKHAADDVEVRPHETTVAVLSPVPARQVVRVTRHGEPAPGQTVVLYHAPRSGPASRRTAVSDENGEAVFRVDERAAAFLLTEAEAEWADALPAAGRVLDGRTMRSRLLELSPFGGSEPRVFEIANPEEMILRIRVDLPERQSFTSATLRPTSPQSGSSAIRHFVGATIADELVFTFVATGTYALNVSIESLYGSRGSTTEELQVEAPAAGDSNEVRLTVSPALYLLEIEVDAPGIPRGDLRVAITTLEAEHSHRGVQIHWQDVNDEGRVLIDCLSPGARRIRVQAESDSGFLRHSMTRIVDVQGDTRSVVTLSPDAGVLEVNFDIENMSDEARRRQLQFMGGTGPQFVLKDDSGNLVEHEFETLSTSRRLGFGIAGIAPGTYTVRILVRGFLAIELDDVQIADARVTRFETVPLPAVMLSVRLDGLPLHWPGTGEGLPDVSVVLEDADGNELSMDLPQNSVVLRRTHTLAGLEWTVSHFNLTPEVKRVRIKVESLKEISIRLDAGDGEFIQIGVDAELE
jgi:hypothetical protein